MRGRDGRRVCTTWPVLVDTTVRQPLAGARPAGTGDDEGSTAPGGSSRGSAPSGGVPWGAAVGVGLLVVVAGAWWLVRRSRRP